MLKLPHDLRSGRKRRAIDRDAARAAPFAKCIRPHMAATISGLRYVHAPDPDYRGGNCSLCPVSTRSNSAKNVWEERPHGKRHLRDVDSRSPRSKKKQAFLSRRLRIPQLSTCNLHIQRRRLQFVSEHHGEDLMTPCEFGITIRQEEAKEVVSAMKTTGSWLAERVRPIGIQN